MPRPVLTHSLFEFCDRVRGSFVLLGNLSISYLNGKEMGQGSCFLSFIVSGTLFEYI